MKNYWQRYFKIYSFLVSLRFAFSCALTTRRSDLRARWAWLRFRFVDFCLAIYKYSLINVSTKTIVLKVVNLAARQHTCRKYQPYA